MLSQRTLTLLHEVAKNQVLLKDTVTIRFKYYVSLLEGLKKNLNWHQTLGEDVTSQPGEWPHTCVVLEKNNEDLSLNLLGGASLIAPKVVVTAAHILE